MATQSSQLFPLKEQFPSSISNHNLRLKKYWNGGNKILRANLACSFILPPQLSNLETSSKQPSPVNILASKTNSAEASTHPALLLGVGRGFCFGFSYLAWLSSHESHSPCALSHPWFPFYSQLYSLHMLLCVKHTMLCSLFSFEKDAFSSPYSKLLQESFPHFSSTSCIPLVKKITLLLMEMSTKECCTKSQGTSNLPCFWNLSEVHNRSTISPATFVPNLFKHMKGKERGKLNYLFITERQKQPTDDI